MKKHLWFPALSLVRDPEDYPRSRAKSGLPKIDPALAKKLGID
jgi:hypothetical protein